MGSFVSRCLFRWKEKTKTRVDIIEHEEDFYSRIFALQCILMLGDTYIVQMGVFSTASSESELYRTFTNAELTQKLFRLDVRTKEEMHNVMDRLCAHPQYRITMLRKMIDPSFPIDLVTLMAASVETNFEKERKRNLNRIWNQRLKGIHWLMNPLKQEVIPFLG